MSNDTFIVDLLEKMYMVRQHDPEFFLSTAHDFACTLDIIKVTGKAPEQQMAKWKEFEGERTLAICSIPASYEAYFYQCLVGCALASAA